MFGFKSYGEAFAAFGALVTRYLRKIEPIHHFLSRHRCQCRLPTRGDLRFRGSSESILAVTSLLTNLQNFHANLQMHGRLCRTPFAIRIVGGVRVWGCCDSRFTRPNAPPLMAYNQMGRPPVTPLAAPPSIGVVPAYDVPSIPRSAFIKPSTPLDPSDVSTVTDLPESEWDMPNVQSFDWSPFDGTMS
jgi:hypothetical protein